jgi:hypothetical protein
MMPAMRSGETARLYLNNTLVGVVVVQRQEDSWAHGRFEPGPEFAQFAPLFGQWSLLMHADGEFDRLSPEAGEELRRIEFEIDGLRAKLHFAETDQWLRCAQLNIDGELIEWKEY